MTIRNCYKCLSFINDEKDRYVILQFYDGDNPDNTEYLCNNCEKKKTL